MASAASSPRRYPKEWSDEQTMRVLFSPFRQNRDVNTHSWDSKMRFWTEMIKTYCSDNNSVVIRAPQLPRVFERKGQVPTCLKVVMEEMKRQGEIMTVSDFRIQAQPGWLSWGYNWLVRKPVSWGFSSLVKKPLSWAYTNLITGEVEDATNPKTYLNIPDESYVVIEKVKTMSDAIHSHHLESSSGMEVDDVVGYDQLRKSCCEICADELSFELCIADLCRRKLCSLVIEPNGDKILHMHRGENNKTVLSEAAVQIYKLKTTAGKLEEEIDESTKEMEDCRLKAKEFLRQGRKDVALRYLKKKKKLEDAVNKKEKSIDNIHGMIAMIQDADHNKKIVDAYSSGVQAFKGLTSKHGLTEGGVDKIMADIQEVYDDNEEINESMAQRIVPEEYDDEELEQELDDLITARLPDVVTDDITLPSADISKDILDLPDVPSFDLTPPKNQPIRNQQQRITPPQFHTS